MRSYKYQYCFTVFSFLEKTTLHELKNDLSIISKTVLRLTELTKVCSEETRDFNMNSILSSDSSETNISESVIYP